MPKNSSKSVHPAPHGSRKIAAFTTATIVAFSLTLLAAGIAILTGMVPMRGFADAHRVDLGALLFMMPVLALVLAVCFEVVCIATQAAELPEPRRRQTVRWAPSRDDG